MCRICQYCLSDTRLRKYSAALRAYRARSRNIHAALYSTRAHGYSVLSVQYFPAFVSLTLSVCFSASFLFQHACGHDKTTQRGCRAPDSLIHAVSGLYATCLQAGAVILIDALISGQRIASVQAASASYTAVFVITFIAVIFSVSISVVILSAAAFIIAESGIIRCGFLNGTPVQLQIYRLCPVPAAIASITGTNT